MSSHLPHKLKGLSWPWRLVGTVHYRTPAAGEEPSPDIQPKPPVSVSCHSPGMSLFTREEFSACPSISPPEDVADHHEVSP